MQFDIVAADTASPDDRAVILDLLVAYNDSHAGPHGHKPVTLLLRDSVTGRTIGGLWGRSSYDWLYIELLAVPEELRGRDVGTALMRQAEKIAIERGCVGAWLDTFGFQARGFYEKLGYEVFGVLEDHPRGWQRFFLRKMLPTATR
jgi:GNAT superfamily N-acetyltransferase